MKFALRFAFRTTYGTYTACARLSENYVSRDKVICSTGGAQVGEVPKVDSPLIVDSTYVAINDNPKLKS